MSTVASDACDPWHSDFTAVNESYLAKLLYVVFWVQPYRTCFAKEFTRISNRRIIPWSILNCSRHSPTEDNETRSSGGANYIFIDPQLPRNK
jgi:hypothetical protein